MGNPRERCLGHPAYMTKVKEGLKIELKPDVLRRVTQQSAI